MPEIATTRTDLLLLGLLLDRPMHGYELYQEIRAGAIDEWFDVSMAGVYYSLGKLRDQGLVAVSRQGGERSTRKSIYRLTEEGRAAFFSTMEAQAAGRESVFLDYDVVVYFLNKLPLQRAIPLLEERQAFLAQQASEAQASLVAETSGGQPPLRYAILDHRRRYLEMEQAWLAEVVRSSLGQGGATQSTQGEGRGLMILSGDLLHFHLPDLLRLIISGRHSGTLTVTDGVLIRSIRFAEGQLVSATARRQDEMAAPQQTPEQVTGELCDLFRWQEGRFTFDQQTSEETRSVALRLTADELVLYGCRWVDNWTIIQRLVPSADTIFEMSATPDQVTVLPLTDLERRISGAVDGTGDVAAIARRLGVTLFEASRAFYCLSAVGVVRTANLDKIRLRRVFRETAELMCGSTLAWRTSPEDRTCEDEVNKRCEHLPPCLNRGLIGRCAS
jgi:DNA-binding PadR family transcriptional regulator